MQILADEATQGFVVFSVGSFISGSSLPHHLLQVFLTVFAKLPYRIFWKFEQNDKFPPNVVRLDWVPQQVCSSVQSCLMNIEFLKNLLHKDLIAHPNCKLLISHGGLLGLQEAIYHSMPFLGLPFGSDQKGNMARAVSEGYALKLDWNDLNEQNLFDSITSLINEPRYQINSFFGGDTTNITCYNC